VKDFLIENGPFEGISEELAEEIGIPWGRLWAALHRIRSAEFIAEQHWTIPNVPKGLAYKSWSVVEERDDEEALRDGFKVRAPEVIETMRRLQAQSALAVGTLDKRTTEGRWWSLVNEYAAAVVAAGETMVAQSNPQYAGITSE
jgi:hypothetical protein